MVSTPPNTDFEDLGLVLLNCMDGKIRSTSCSVLWAKEQRAKNKLYGLKSAERWSGYRNLVDLLDDLFGDRLPVAKIEKPVRDTKLFPS